MAFTYYKLDSGSQQTYSAPFAVTGGSHTISYWSVDVAGNTETPHTATFNFAPVANAQSVSVAENGTVAIKLTGSNPNGSGQLTYVVTVKPTHGTLIGNAPNLTYAPKLGYVGSDSFKFTVSSGGLTSAPATVAITVTGKVVGKSLGGGNGGFFGPLTLVGEDIQRPLHSRDAGAAPYSRPLTNSRTLSPCWSTRTLG